jgi:Uma2 family endonuclease
MSALPERYRFSIEQYHRMGEAGILNEDSRVELIEGGIIKMAPIGSEHAAVVNTIAALFIVQAKPLLVSVQNPVILGPDSEPQPDLMLLKGRRDKYRSRLPQATDVLLIVEVADTTIARDRNIKIPLYAGAGIPEVWLIDLPGKAVEISADPQGRVYRHSDRAVSGMITPRLAPQIQIDPSEIFS